MREPLAWSKAPKEDLKKIKAVCLDIDDTFSSHGKITAEAYRSLWNLKNAGFVVVPITGRPAGWCDHIARFWPVDAVVGENGAFTFFMQDGVRRRIETPMGMKADQARSQLEALEKKIKAKFPEARWASDQAYREFDLAIDICEDVKPWNEGSIDQLLKLCEAEGAYAKLSSVHVNAWFGNYNKYGGLTHWVNEGAPGLKGKTPLQEEWLYIGDSPNDEPLFEAFPYSVGVSNLRPYLSRLKHHPDWITENDSGKGFSEMAKKLIDSHAK